VSATRLRVVAPDDFPRAVEGHPELARLKDVADVVVYGERATSDAELRARLAGAHVLFNIRAYTRVTDELLRDLPDLALVVVMGVGVDNIDLAAADRHGVLVCNAPGANARSVAEHTIGLMLAVVRHICRYDRELRAGLWQHHDTPELEGKTLGVLGLGNIGRIVARLGAAFGMRVLAWSRTHDPARAAACGATLVDREPLLRESDVVCLCLSATPETRHLIDAAALALMKPGAVLVNTARGALVDEAALVAALRAGRIAGAGLDVFEQEPLPPDSPLRSLGNVVLTPHAGWVSREARDRLVRVPVDNILAYLAGRPQNLVNPGALAHPRHHTVGGPAR
jgi:phosphoglycerate dehydrogenase-like enzyme